MSVPASRSATGKAKAASEKTARTKSVQGRSATAPRGKRDSAAPRRDADRSRRLILDAALVEFSEKGYSGARIDTIAAQAGVSKPMIYSYYGDKDDLYAAALREAYIQIRAGESELQLEN
ncbi:MAG: helix-turn-helix transcriptional regulator, partial [Granulosicoccus sp.]|nr:helix-turn-helix transcriptional regulator [Granulosicoccus sp.]